MFLLLPETIIMQCDFTYASQQCHASPEKRKDQNCLALQAQLCTGCLIQHHILLKTLPFMMSQRAPAPELFAIFSSSLVVFPHTNLIKVHQQDSKNTGRKLLSLLPEAANTGLNAMLSDCFFYDEQLTTDAPPGCNQRQQASLVSKM